MLTKPTTAPKNEGAHLTFSQLSGTHFALQYTLPVLRETKSSSYIEYYAYDPERGRLRRKRIKLDRIKGKANLRAYAKQVINRLTVMLIQGYNPWMSGDPSGQIEFNEALTRYEEHVEKMLASGYFRKETYAGYKSNIKILRKYIDEKNRIHYVYQFNRKFCVDFLDYIFIDRGNGAQTRNNYLNFLRVFCGFLVEKGYAETKATEGIAPISKRLYKKERGCIPPEIVGKIGEYCRERDPYFLLACYLLYYCFIRPVEMTRLKIGDFNLKAGTLTVPAESSKNHKAQTVTLPKKVLLYAIDLGVFSSPMGDYLFSDGLLPGREEIDPKIFRDHWAKVRKALNLRREWKFYSLKDTGITAMLKDNMAAIDVRDQARHSSLSITEIYTDHSARVNPDILDLDGAL